MIVCMCAAVFNGLVALYAIRIVSIQRKSILIQESTIDIQRNSIANLLNRIDLMMKRPTRLP